ncbi:hypothetical protein KBD08_00160 [Candidatus Babeliales bacterium]|nr:hypothetical protein [Candidatus Babeliales bacterium]
MKIKLKMQILAGLIFAGCVMHMLVEPSKTKRRPIAPFVVEAINPDDVCMICQQDAQDLAQEGRLYSTDCCKQVLCEADLVDLQKDYRNKLTEWKMLNYDSDIELDDAIRAELRREYSEREDFHGWPSKPILTCPGCRKSLSTHEVKVKQVQSQLPPQATAIYESENLGTEFDADLAAALELSRNVAPTLPKNVPPRATALPSSQIPPQATARSQSPVSRAGRPSGQAVSYHDEEAMLQAALEASLLTEQPRVRPEDELQVAIAESLRAHAAEQEQRQALSQAEFLPKAPVSRFEYARSLAGQPKVILVPPQQVSRQVFVNPKATSLEEVD